MNSELSGDSFKTDRRFAIKSSIRGIWQFLNRHAIISISAPFIIGLGVQAAFKSSEWIEVFVRAARVLQAGGDIYGAGTAYLYPPFMAFMTIPFVPLPELAARLGWFALNVACIVGLIRSAWLLSGGSALGSINAENRQVWAVAGAGILCSASYILNALAHQQVDVFIAFLVVAGCLLLVRGQDISGAVLIGLAAACKGPPLLFAAYLVFRRKWLSAALIVLIAVAVNFLPDLVIPAPGGQSRLLIWLERFVVPNFKGHLGEWDGIRVFNQSIAGTVQRAFTTTLQSMSSHVVIVTGFRQVPEALIKSLAYGLMLSLLAASILATLRGQAFTRARTSIIRFPSHTALEMSAVAILMLLLSPMTDLAHLGPLILPGFCLARFAIFGANRIIGATMIVAAAGALLANKDLVGDTIYTALLWGGIATWSMLALWAGCVTALAKGQAEPPVSGFANSIFPFLARLSTAHA